MIGVAQKINNETVKRSLLDVRPLVFGLLVNFVEDAVETLFFDLSLHFMRCVFIVFLRELLKGLIKHTVVGLARPPAFDFDLVSYLLAKYVVQWRAKIQIPLQKLMLFDVQIVICECFEPVEI